MRHLIRALTAVAVLGAALLTTAAPASAAPPVPAGVTAGIAVFDRQTGTFTEEYNVDLQFRSASVVKLLIALDYLWNRGPSYTIPAADRGPLDAMLRSSDDNAASTFWARGGYEQVVNRMVTRLQLQNTAPPPVAQRTYWGYTAITAADTVRIYRYILDTAPAAVRDYVMDNLRASTRCGADGYNQAFGIPTAFQKPWAVKQGWSGFGADGTCSNSTSLAATAASVDLVREALHTTGTVGAGDRSIVAVFTLHPDGTSLSAASTTVTKLTRALHVNGASVLPGTWFGTWGSGVRVRATPSTSAAVLGTVPSGAEVLVACQQLGQEVVVDPYRNAWWAYLPQYGGFMTNIYVSSPDNVLPGVPTC
ncbi:MAG TPA: SH3 domain-containing protein [Dactylosporangium sp.]|jgi:hypothetical protein|nr:SH3 domain-containing protein [Dactylosporangium sp.]